MGLMTGVIIGYDVSLADLGAGIVTQVSKTLVSATVFEYRTFQPY